MRISNFLQLVEVCSDPAKFLRFVISYGLIRRCHRCRKRCCRRQMTVIHDASRPEKYAFRCPKCHSSISVRKGSLFESSHLSISEILYLTFCWSAKIPVTGAVTICNISMSSVSYWYQYLRGVCSGALLGCADSSLGGVGAVVQVYASVVSKRKYCGEVAVDQQWAFVLYDTTKKVGHIQLVEDQRAETLLPIIQSHVKLESTIVSDQSAAYQGLLELGYQHVVVAGSACFVDPIMGATINPVKAYWSRAKRSIHLHWLSRRDQLPLRLNEFLWRDRLPSNKYPDVFHEMLGLMTAK